MVNCLHDHCYSGAVTLPMLTQNVNSDECCLKYLKLVFEVTEKLQNSPEWPFTTNPHVV